MLRKFAIRLGCELYFIPIKYMYDTVHRGLKLDGAIGQGEICNSEFSWIFTKTEFFEKNKSSKIS